MGKYSFIIMAGRVTSGGDGEIGMEFGKVQAFGTVVLVHDGWHSPLPSHWHQPHPAMARLVLAVTCKVKPR